MKKSPFLRSIASISASLMVSLSISPLFSSALDTTPTLTLSQFSKSFSEVDANGDGSLSLAERTFDVYMDVSGAKYLWSDMSLHITLSNGLTFATNSDGSPKATWGRAVKSNSSKSASFSDSSSVLFTSSGQKLSSTFSDGTQMWSGGEGNIVIFTVVLPQSATSGNRWNISYNFAPSDFFTTSDAKSAAGNNTDAITSYATQHLSNGYIEIQNGSAPIQTTTSSTTTTTTTTTIPTTTSTTTTTTIPTTTSTTTTTTIPTTTSTTTTNTIPTTTSTTSATTIPTTTSATTTSTAPTTTVYILGDIDGNKRIDAGDASIALTEYAYTSTGRGSLLSFFQKQAADVHNDGIVDAIDASLILTYYSKFSINGYASFNNL